MDGIRGFLIFCKSSDDARYRFFYFLTHKMYDKMLDGVKALSVR